MEQWPNKSRVGMALHFCELGHFGVAPEVLDLIEIAGLWVEYMHYRVEIVHEYPTRVAGAFGMRRHRVEVFFDLLVHAVCDGFDVSIGVAFADDEKIRRRIEFPQV